MIKKRIILIYLIMLTSVSSSQEIDINSAEEQKILSNVMDAYFNEREQIILDIELQKKQCKV